MHKIPHASSTIRVDLKIWVAGSWWFFAQSHRGGGEFDLVVEGEDERTLAIEVRKRKTKIGVGDITRFLKKLDALKASLSTGRIVPAYLALGGFTDEALAVCREQGVGVADRMSYIQQDWSL